MSSPGAPTPLLAVRDLHTYIGGSHILQGVTFDVAPGHTTVLLGRNGAGKSTTLRTIMGLLPAQTGSITLAEQELRGRPPYIIARCGVAFVPEDREVFVTLTVEENLHLARRPGGAPGRRAERSRASPGGRGSEGAAIARVYSLFPDLQEARHRSAGALSGGQQQMLAIGRALVNSNRILLVDEPTKGLAPVIIKELRALFSALRQRGETILLVEQNLDFARSVGDQYHILDEGRIVHGGPMEELAARPEILRRYVGV